MRLLFEGEVNKDLASLARAWADPETFAFVPDKCAVSLNWLNDALASLPVELATDHFSLLTSGSTGEPKLVVGQRWRADRLTRVLHELQESEPVAETILALPLTYTYSFVNQWLWARCHDRRLVPTPGFGQPDVLREALSRAKDAMLCLVGVQVALLARHFSDESFSGVIRVHFAGGRFPQEKLDIVDSLFPNARVFNNYGCAEAMPRLTLRPADAIDDATNIGWPLPGVRLKAGEGGKLLFRSPYGAVGYVDGCGFKRFASEEWVPTGDLGRSGQDGSWWLTGRGSEVFKRYGEKVSLSLLLTTVSRYWTGNAVFYRERDGAGEEGHVLVLAPRPIEEQLRAILKSFRANHPRALWPLRIESVDTFPVLPNGKIDVRTLASSGGEKIYWRQRI